MKQTAKRNWNRKGNWIETKRERNYK